MNNSKESEALLQYYIWTIGCQMNKAESQQIAGHLESAGYKSTDYFYDANLVILNTCVVRQSAEDKVLGTLGLLKGLRNKHGNMHVLVTGCFVDSDIKGLKRQFPQVDLFFKPGDYTELMDWVKKQGIHVEPGLYSDPFARLGASAQCNNGSKGDSPCAFIPIIQGCDNFCSYCIVPYRRGREASRPLDEIACEVKQLTGRGIKEVTLLGQNVDSYGHDLPERSDLANLLTELNGIDDLLRIRFLTNHPKDVSLKLIKAIAALDKVCEHLELPVQAGDDDILENMRRGYTVEQYRELVKVVRDSIPEISLSTDVIVGFPGETEEQFEHTFRLLEEMRFDVVHLAAYSPRTGTIAWREYEDNVLAAVKKQRFNRVEKLQASIASEINSQLQGKPMKVLVEGMKGGKWFGRTRSDKLVFFRDTTNRLAQLVEVRIDKTSPWALQGEVVN